MINPTVNTTVLIIFGSFIGCLLQLVSLLTGEHRRSQKERRSKLISAEEVEAAAERALSGPRSFKIALIAFYGLIAILLIVLKYSPLQMDWLIFLSSVFAGFFVLQLIFSLAKAGKIRFKSNKFLGDLSQDNRNK